MSEYSNIAQQYWDQEYVNLGYKVVHDAGTFQKTMSLASREIDLFLFPTKEKCDELLSDKENNPFPTFHDDFWIHQPITEYIQNLDQKVVLDYGCGNMARYSIALSKYFKIVYGVDISAKAIVDAKLITRGIKNICLLKNDGVTIPLGNESVDFIFSNLVLQHIGVKVVNIALASEFSRILKKGGIARLEYLDGSQKKEDDFGHVSEGNGFSTEEITEVYKTFGVEVLTATERYPYLWITVRKK